MARFFIDRPIFAWVIAIIIIAGGLALFKLPVSIPQRRTAGGGNQRHLPGCIGQGGRGLGDADHRAEHEGPRWPDLLLLQQLVQRPGHHHPDLRERHQPGHRPGAGAEQAAAGHALLPQEVQRQGINVAKSSSGFLNVIAFVSENGSMDANDIADYVGSNVVDRLSRVPGVGNIRVRWQVRHAHLAGPEQAAYLWPVRRGSDCGDQGTECPVAIGQLGGAPSVKGQQLNATINAQSRLQTPEQFRNIIVRGAQDGAELRLGDVARVELGLSPTTSSPATTASRPAAWRSPGHRRQRAGYCGRRGRCAGRHEELLPGRAEGRDPVRHHPVRARVDQGRGADPARSDRAGVRGDVPVPAELPRHPDPDHRRAGGTAGYLRRAGDAGLR